MFANYVILVGQLFAMKGERPIAEPSTMLLLKFWKEKIMIGV
jgi:hypothetical protein